MGSSRLNLVFCFAHYNKYIVCVSSYVHAGKLLFGWLLTLFPYLVIILHVSRLPTHNLYIIHQLNAVIESKVKKKKRYEYSCLFLQKVKNIC